MLNTMVEFWLPLNEKKTKNNMRIAYNPGTSARFHEWTVDIPNINMKNYQKHRRIRYTAMFYDFKLLAKAEFIFKMNLSQ